jgi:small subunit ribosomal protein S3Ae
VEIISPKMFNSKSIGHTVTSDFKNMEGRIITVNMGEITGEYNPRQRLKLRFRIDKIEGNQAKTKFLGHSIPQDYMKTVARKRNSKVYIKQEVRTRDDKRFIVKSTVVIDRSATRSTKTAINKRYREILAMEAKNSKFSELISSILGNRLSIKAKKDLHKIYPVKHIVIEKTEIDDSVQLPDEPIARNRSRRREGMQRDYHKGPRAEKPKAEEEKKSVKAEQREGEKAKEVSKESGVGSEEKKEKPVKEEKPEKKEEKK